MEELLGYFQILRRRWLISSAIFISVLVLGFIRASKEVPMYRAKGQILVSSESASPWSPEFGQYAWFEQRNLANELAIIKSENLAERVAEQLNLDMSASQLLQKFNVVNPEGTDLLDFSYTSPDPQQATSILNSWMENYVRLDQQTALSESITLKEFLEEQIPKSQEDLRLSAQKLKFFKQKNRILDIETRATSIASAITELDKQRETLQVELDAENIRLQHLEQFLGTNNSEEAILSTLVTDSPLGSSMLEKLQEIKSKIDQEKLRFGQNHPQIVSLKKQEASLRQQLQDYMNKNFVADSNSLIRYSNVENILQPGEIQKQLVQEHWNTERKVAVLQQQLQSLDKLKLTYNQQINEIPELEFKQKQLEREVFAREKILENLIENNQEVQLNLNKKPSHLDLIQYAEVPKDSFFDRKQTLLVQSFVGAIFISFLVAYILDKLDDKITSLDDVQKILDYPVIGRIPEFSEENNIKINGQFSQIPVKELPSSIISEAFNFLFTGIQLISPEKHKTILISSCLPSEGKSTVAANLALSAIEIGLKVLLIEVDLRKPSQCKIWNIEQDQGTVDFLSGDSPLESLFVPTANNLDLLVAGKVESKPLNLITSDNMTELLNYAHENYDLVIIDAPPLTVGAETAILGRMVDGVIMVSRLGKLTRSSIENNKDLITRSNLKIIGLVYNSTSSREKYGYYKNYYGYSAR